MRVIAEQVFRKIAPDQAEKICKKVEDGLLTLEELDKLALEFDAVESGAIKLIFGTASLIDVARSAKEDFGPFSNPITSCGGL